MLPDPFAGRRPPRRWQRECYPAAMDAIRSRRRGVVHACTGSGKTELQLAVLRTVLATLRDGWAVLVTVPSEALVRQTTKAAASLFGAGVVGMFYGKRKQPGARIVVACQDSLERLADAWAVAGTRCALWMSDECHEFSSDALRAVIDERIQPVTRIGLTATPFRSCEAEALKGWEDIVYRYTIHEAQADGVLVPMVCHVGREETLRDGEEVDGIEATIAMIRKHDPIGPGLVSAHSVDEAERVALAMTEAGIPALHVASKMPAKMKDERIAALLRGDIRAIVHVDLLTTGVDIPSLRWICMQRRRVSAVSIVQEVGRGLRTCEPDQWGPKTELVLLLPHATAVYDAVRRPAALGEGLTMLDLEEAAEREASGTPGERIAPLAVSIGDVDAWVAALVSTVRAAGIEVTTPEGGWRRYAPTPSRFEVLADLVGAGVRSPVRYLPAPARKAIRDVVAVPECVSAGACADLVAVLLALRTQAGRHYREHAHLEEKRRYWKGIAEVPEPPATGKTRRAA